VAVHHVASVGLDLWLSAFAYGASDVAVLATGGEAPQYVDALAVQMEFAQAILDGLGYKGIKLRLLLARDAAELDRELQAFAGTPEPESAMPAASFHVAAAKRETLDFAITHLARHAPTPQDYIVLPQGAPFGAVDIDTDKCTFCMACVGACPESALSDNPQAPQLRFTEANCVQCGLCVHTCPEQALALQPRLALGAVAKQARVINEAQPYHCIKCQKPFGTLQMVENMVSKLAGHGAFAGNLERLRMCPDCRVVDMLQPEKEVTIFEVKRQ